MPRADRASIVSFCLSGFPGSGTALANLSAVTGRTRHLVLAAADPRGPEVRFFRRYLGDVRPPLAVFGGWSDAYRSLVRAQARAGRRVAVYWTSSPGQTGMAGELIDLARLLDEPTIDRLWVVHRGLAAALGRISTKVEWMPNIFPPPRASRAPRARSVTGVSQVSLFCSPREASRKNAWCTLLAIAGLDRPYHLHLNGLSQVEPFGRLLERMHVPFTEHGWMNRDVYERTIAEMHAGLQVSMAESFDFVAADHILRGVPVLASPMVPVVAALPTAVRCRWIVANPDDPIAIRTALSSLLADRDRARIATIARRALLAANRRDIAVARRVLSRALSASPR